MKNILSNNGFGLTQVLVASGLLGVMAVALMNMNKLGLQGASKAESKQEGNFFLDDLDKRLKGTTLCQETLGGVTMAAEYSFSEFTFNGNPLYPVDSKVGSGKLTVKSYKLTNDSVPLTGNASGVAYLEVGYTEAKSAGGRLIYKKIPLLINTDATNKITDCVSDTQLIIANLKEEICNDLGGSMISGKCTNITPIIGDDAALACNASQEGRIRYEPTNKVIQVCDGANWSLVTGTINDGDCTASSIDKWISDPGGDTPTPALKNWQIHYVDCSTYGGNLLYQCQNGALVKVYGYCNPPGP